MRIGAAVAEAGHRAAKLAPPETRTDPIAWKAPPANNDITDFSQPRQRTDSGFGARRIAVCPAVQVAAQVADREARAGWQTCNFKSEPDTPFLYSYAVGKLKTKSQIRPRFTAMDADVSGS